MKPLIVENVSPLGQAGRLGLREGDIILAKNYEPITQNAQEFALSLFTADFLLTIGRGDKIFDVNIKKGLGLNLNDTIQNDVIDNLIKVYEERENIIPLDQLENFNILSFFEDFIAVRTKINFVPAIFPPFWLMYEGLFLQALSIFGLYALAFLVHNFVFYIVFIICSIYFYRNQIETLLTDKYLKGCQPVIVIAAESEQSALDKARVLFPGKVKDEDNELFSG